MFLLQWHAVRLMCLLADHIGEFTVQHQIMKWIDNSALLLFILNGLAILATIILKPHECNILSFAIRLTTLHTISASGSNFLWPRDNLYHNMYEPKAIHLLTLLLILFSSHPASSEISPNVIYLDQRCRSCYGFCSRHRSWYRPAPCG